MINCLLTQPVLLRAEQLAKRAAAGELHFRALDLCCKSVKWAISGAMYCMLLLKLYVMLCFWYVVFCICETFNLSFVRHFLKKVCHSNVSASLLITVLSCGWNTYRSQQAVSLFVQTGCLTGLTGLRWDEHLSVWPFVDRKLKVFYFHPA